MHDKYARHSNTVVRFWDCIELKKKNHCKYFECSSADHDFGLPRPVFLVTVTLELRRYLSAPGCSANIH